MRRADVRARLRAWLFVHLVHAPTGLGPAVLAALGGGLLTALGMGAALAPALHDELDAAIRLREQLLAQIDALRAQPSRPAEQTPPSSDSAAMARPWRWLQAARTSGLQIEQWQADRAGGPQGGWHLRLRGRYHQHAAWVALLAGDLAAPALLSYRLQNSEGGLLRAEVQLQPWAAVPAELPAPGAAQTYRAAAHLDPFGGPTPSDPQATLPAPWRAEFQRPRRWLEVAPLQDLDFTGTLRQGAHWVALVRWERLLYTVRVGDTLGPQRGRVQRIAEHGLWLREIVLAEDGRWQERERLWRVGERP